MSVAAKILLSDRDAFFAHVGVETVHKGTRGILSVWYPDKSREDLASLRFVVEDVSGMRRAEGEDVLALARR